MNINQVGMLLKEQLGKTNLQDIHAPTCRARSIKEGVEDLCKKMYETALESELYRRFF